MKKSSAKSQPPRKSPRAPNPSPYNTQLTYQQANFQGGVHRSNILAVNSQPLQQSTQQKYALLRYKNAHFREQSLMETLQKMLNRRKRYCFQVIKQFYLFPDQTISESISIDPYDRLFYNDQYIHTIVKIFETKELQAKIWAFLNIKALRLKKQLEQFTKKVSEIEQKKSAQYSSIGFSNIKQYSINIMVKQQFQRNIEEQKARKKREKEEEMQRERERKQAKKRQLQQQRQNKRRKQQEDAERRRRQREQEQKRKKMEKLAKIQEGQEQMRLADRRKSAEQLRKLQEQQLRQQQKRYQQQKQREREKQQERKEAQRRLSEQKRLQRQREQLEKRKAETQKRQRQLEQKRRKQEEQRRIQSERRRREEKARRQNERRREQERMREEQEKRRREDERRREEERQRRQEEKRKKEEQQRRKKEEDDRKRRQQQQEEKRKRQDERKRREEERRKKQREQQQRRKAENMERQKERKRKAEQYERQRQRKADELLQQQMRKSSEENLQKQRKAEEEERNMQRAQYQRQKQQEKRRAQLVQRQREMRKRQLQSQGLTNNLPSRQQPKQYHPQDKYPSSIKYEQRQEKHAQQITSFRSPTKPNLLPSNPQGQNHKLVWERPSNDKQIYEQVQKKQILKQFKREGKNSLISVSSSYSKIQETSKKQMSIGNSNKAESLGFSSKLFESSGQPRRVVVHESAAAVLKTNPEVIRVTASASANANSSRPEDYKRSQYQGSNIKVIYAGSSQNPLSTSYRSRQVEGNRIDSKEDKRVQKMESTTEKVHFSSNIKNIQDLRTATQIRRPLQIRRPVNVINSNNSVERVQAIPYYYTATYGVANPSRVINCSQGSEGSSYLVNTVKGNCTINVNCSHHTHSKCKRKERSKTCTENQNSTRNQQSCSKRSHCCHCAKACSCHHHAQISLSEEKSSNILSSSSNSRTIKQASVIRTNKSNTKKPTTQELYDMGERIKYLEKLEEAYASALKKETKQKP